jgi:multiple sugar transport system substrate-binding protein
MIGITKPRAKYALPAIAALAVCGLLAGCATPPATNPSAVIDGSTEKPESLRLLYTTAEANAAALQSRVDAFEDEFGIKLEVDTQPYDALQQRVFSEFASSSDYYDIVVVDTPWASALVDNLEPLSGYLTSDELNSEPPVVEDFIPKVFYDTAVYDATNPIREFSDVNSAPDVENITSAGFDIFGLPIQANVALMAYRKDLFENPEQRAAFEAEYGRELAVPQTWDEYAEVAEFFTQPDLKIYGTTVMAGVGDWSTDDFKTLLASFGGDGKLVSDDLSLAFDSPEGVRALDYYRSLVKDGVVPPGSTSASWTETAEVFDAGLTAMTINYHSLALADGVEGEIGYAPVPRDVGAGPHFGTWMLSINKYSTKKEWAYQAIKWLTSSEQQIAMTELKLHPTRVSVYDAVAQQSGDSGQSAFYATLGESLAVGVGRARLTNYMEVSNAVAVQVNRAASGDATSERAIEEMVRSVTALLEQAGYQVGGN